MASRMLDGSEENDAQMAKGMGCWCVWGIGKADWPTLAVSDPACPVHQLLALAFADHIGLGFVEHEQVETPNWDTRIRCRCGYDSTNNMEFFRHRGDAYRAQLEER